MTTLENNPQKSSNENVSEKNQFGRIGKTLDELDDRLGIAKGG